MSETGNKIRIVLVEDHQPTRAEIRALIERQPDLTVVAEAENGEDALIIVGEARPDIVVMDILLPGLNGIETARRLHVEQPAVKILALSNHFGNFLIQAILDAGGQGYVQKSRAFEELIPALRAVAAGQQYVGKEFVASKP